MTRIGVHPLAEAARALAVAQAVEALGDMLTPTPEERAVGLCVRVFRPDGAVEVVAASDFWAMPANPQEGGGE